MKKSLTALFALVFALMFGLVNVASAMKHEAPAGKGAAKTEQKKEDKAVTKACKDKKAGDVVIVDGKEVKCPEKKKMKKKTTEKKAVPAAPASPAAPAAPAPAR